MYLVILDINDVVYRVTFDVSADTQCCMPDVCGNVCCDILAKINENNVRDALPFVADVIVGTSATCACPAACLSTRSEGAVTMTS